MIKYIFNKYFAEKKDMISSVIIVGCITSVVMVCVQIALRLNMMLEDDWYKNSIEILSAGDPFIREKTGVIIKFVFALLAFILAFCVIVYILKIKLDITREKERLSVFLVLGYTKKQVTGFQFVGKMFELIIGCIVGLVISYLLWLLLCQQDVFKDFFGLIDKKLSYRMSAMLVSFVLYSLITLIATYMVIGSNIGLMDMKGDGNE